MYVILTAVDSAGRQVANFGACDGPIGERIAWGRPGTPDEDDLLIFFDVEVKAGLWSECETMFEVESACDRFIQEYRMCMKGFNSKQAVQKYVFEDSYDPSKPDIAIMKEVPGQGAVYETWALADEPMTPIRKKMEGINYTCAPMCVVGCLNRHASDGGHRYSSPAESEVNAALISCFGFSDPELASRIQHKATELGIISSEFVTSAKVYAEAVGITIVKGQGESTDDGAESDSAVPESSSDEARADVHSSELLLDWLDEIDNGTVLGRVIASRTHGVASLYGEKDLRELLDRKAIQDEDRYNVRMSAMYPSLSHLSPLELLYDQIFVLENLGLCIFTSFALLDDPDCLDILAEQFEARSGVSATAEEMILYAGKCIENEKAFEFRRWRAAQKADIPQFTKVLYSYFDSKQHAQG